MTVRLTDYTIDSRSYTYSYFLKYLMLEASVISVLGLVNGLLRKA